MATPSKPLKDAIADYQKANPYSRQAFEGLFPYLQKQGYQVARTTHANNTLASDDALVDNAGNVYDLVLNSDNAPGGGTPGWTLNQSGAYDPNRSIVGPDGKFIKYSEWAGQNGGASPAASSGQPPAGGTTTALGQGGQPFAPGVGGRLRFIHKPTVAADRAARNAGNSPASPPSSGNPYEAAAVAAARSRMTANRGGRRGTILGGFGSGRPSTRPATVLGY